ncbi:hypothetical protein PG985_001807 [Apiospora marii]|uniref:uncharacterized protein n=1 Tax=Apiospora marii TaxID=335849 RepID=UPI0031307953
MPEALAKQLLVQYAHILPSLAQGVLDKSHELRSKEARTTRSYREFARETDYLINKKHRRLRPSQQYEIAGEVQGEIETMLDTIEREIQPHSSFESKYSALETMLQIYETIMDAGNQLGSEVQKDCYGWDEQFLKVFGCLTPGDRDRLANDQCSASHTDTWLDRLDGFVQEALDYCFVEGIDKARDSLQKVAYHKATGADPTKQVNV